EREGTRGDALAPMPARNPVADTVVALGLEAPDAADDPTGLPRAVQLDDSRARVRVGEDTFPDCEERLTRAALGAGHFVRGRVALEFEERGQIVRRGGAEADRFGMKTAPLHGPS